MRRMKKKDRRRRVVGVKVEGVGVKKRGKEAKQK
jgi:hypothetical protein